MKPFGKNEEELTPDEKTFYEITIALATGMILESLSTMAKFAELLGLPRPNHNDESVAIIVFGATKLLGLPEPKNQSDFDEMSRKLEESEYSIEKLLDLFKEEYTNFINLPENKKDKNAASEKFAHMVMDKLGIPHKEKESAEDPKG